MKLFVSAWNMYKSRDAFTLIEVMVAVLIISVVIMALIEMQGNTAHTFLKFNKQLKTTQYLSYLLSNKNYGFDESKIDLDELLSEFRVEDELRRELKEIKVKISYDEIDTIDFSESDEEEGEEEVSTGMVFEIGKTNLELEDSSLSLVRFRIQ